MNSFKAYHPIVNFLYFMFVIGFSMFSLNPVCIIISLSCAFIYSVILKGKKAIKINLLYMIPVMIGTALINPVFNHEGITILTYLPSGNPLTLESILYGLFASMLLVCVICHFSCFNEIMTSDKLMYLFSGIIPSLSLVLSMTLRFVPRFLSEIKSIKSARKCICAENSSSVLQKIKRGLSVLSAMTSWSLESSIETADSMKARGFGLRKRAAFSVFKITKRDVSAIVAILFLGIYTLSAQLVGKMRFRFFPSVKYAPMSAFGISAFICFFALCAFPIIIEIGGIIKWNAIKSKI